MPFAENTFDLVFSEYVFEHLPDPKEALHEINRVLRPRGSFVVLVPNPSHYYARVADLTPFWFHILWSKFRGVKSAEQDRFPTQYEWGSYADIHSTMFDWQLKAFISIPGPTKYTEILPVHVLFVLFDRIMANRPQFHVAYVAHYKKLRDSR
ncbi:class I SAM-dependent methyltransferase [Salinarchaeum sp. IM2453]|uniref:class I SAM-dependent methyltransferase n=1 Tax=Salinarchaeum sp. IM2453 TaxID=2862870 RepID=UPI0021063D73